MLARRLAFAVGKYHPLDWARLRDSHTPYEWAVQELCQIIDPIGEEREDMRSAALAFALGQLQRFTRSGFKRSPLDHVDASLALMCR